MSHNYNFPPGYYLATAADDCCVKLWDLRKLKNFKTLQLDDGYEVRDLSFDSSGSYLAVAGSDVRVYLCKQWDSLKVTFSFSITQSKQIKNTKRQKYGINLWPHQSTA